MAWGVFFGRGRELHATARLIPPLALKSLSQPSRIGLYFISHLPEDGRELARKVGIGRADRETCSSPPTDHSQEDSRSAKAEEEICAFLVVFTWADHS